MTLRKRIRRLAMLLIITAGMLSSCALFKKTTPTFPEGNYCIHGVITRSGKLVNDYYIKLDNRTLLTDEDGYYKLDGVTPGINRLFIRRARFSKPRLYPRVRITTETTVLNCDMTPYYAADHGPLQYDWRLHHSWGNAIDDPFDTTSVNVLGKNTATLSGLLLQPVYLSSVLIETVWVPIGFVPTIFTRKKDAKVFSYTLLALYLPVEAIVKGVEIPVKTILWPIDRLVSFKARKQLHHIRDSTIHNHMKDTPED